MAPHIEGQWLPMDESANRLEVAATDETTDSGERLLAIHSTHDAHAPVVFATGGQIKSLAERYQQGRLERLTGGRGR